MENSTYGIERRWRYADRNFLIVLCCNAFLATCLDSFLLYLLRQRNGKRPDLIIVYCFVVSCLISSASRIPTFTVRYWMSFIEPYYIPAWQCISYHLYFPVIGVGTDMVTITIALCSFERYCYFMNRTLYESIFKKCTVGRVMSFTCLIALADLGVCTYLACRKTHEPVLALCIRAQVTSKKYYKIYALHTIIITSISALLYVATLLAQIMVRRRQGIADITLASMRYRRDMQIFKSILLVFTCNVFTQVLPWICIYWKINTNRYDWIDKSMRILENLFLSLSALVYMCIHPDISDQIKRLRPFRYYFKTSDDVLSLSAKLRRRY
ncbi:hypothetical protein M514_04324 [Trichuris suis]|uniref:G-protein coupled receptors family 1 profile domain-containing protein n=1 Tax=Trichuris suis TaxID=68888 RepID=A0A085MX40_9BILA|nr:hypothetical protein M513_04324 [Trichuris suis]KFD61786.1 hypothetical protein M514_04324 [Trichuris suis]